MTALTILCPGCKAVIGQYNGPISAHLRIESKYFAFPDGSHPQPNTVAKHKCKCGTVVNLIEMLRASARSMYTIHGQIGQTGESDNVQ